MVLQMQFGHRVNCVPILAVSVFYLFVFFCKCVCVCVYVFYFKKPILIGCLQKNYDLTSSGDAGSVTTYQIEVNNPESEPISPVRVRVSFNAKIITFELQKINFFVVVYG